MARAWREHGETLNALRDLSYGDKFDQLLQTLKQARAVLSRAEPCRAVPSSGERSEWSSEDHRLRQLQGHGTSTRSTKKRGLMLFETL